jgi:hypothetical protein
MQIAIISAVGANGVIGVDNRLPWHLSEDLQYFKRLTMNSPMLIEDEEGGTQKAGEVKKHEGGEG